jgi:hypothetical protein
MNNPPTPLVNNPEGVATQSIGLLYSATLGNEGDGFQNPNGVATQSPLVGFASNILPSQSLLLTTGYGRCKNESATRLESVSS